MRTLSSRWTWFYKFAFPTLWIGGFGIGTLQMFLDPDSFSGDDPRDVRWAFMAALLLGSAVIYWSCIRVKRVSLDTDAFLISNYRDEIRVPLHDVERVSGSVLWNPELIWLHFRRPTRFGSRVVFIAPMRFFGFGRHPLARELNSLVTGRAAA